MGFELIETRLESFEALAPFRQPLGVALELEIAVPGFDGIDELGAVFHDESFVEEDDGIVGGHLVGAAQIIERGGAVIFAAGGDASLEVGCGVVCEESGRGIAGGDESIEDVDGVVVVFAEQIGAGAESEPVGVRGGLLEVLLDGGAGAEQRGVRVPGCVAAGVRLCDAGCVGRAGNAEIEEAVVPVGKGELLLRSTLA